MFLLEVEFAQNGGYTLIIAKIFEILIWLNPIFYNTYYAETHLDYHFQCDCENTDSLFI